MRLRRSHLTAVAIVVALLAWIGSGQIDRLKAPAAESPLPAAAAPPAGPPPMQVRVRETVAAPVEREIVLNGRTAPARKVELRAEVTGRVVELPAERGAAVSAGRVVAMLDRRDREAWLRQARAALAQAEAEYEAGRKLRQKDFFAETELVAKAAALEQARATVERVTLDLAHTEIAAPFAGVLDRRPVEVGHLVETGDAVATLLELDPLVVIGDVAEIEARDLRIGMAGTAELVTGERVAGRVRFVAHEAEATTRTFRVELEVPNAGSRIPAGTSALVRLPQEPVPAHEVSSAALVLDDSGALGVQTVDDGDVVRFHAASIARAGPDSVWLTGLPARLRLITVGQGFVRAGQKVVPVADGRAAPS
ncbi:MAG TPA: efflux RND transporter periplasmic adaptor subunit [Geminicoccaceae bacterium]|nr:efflux RND transporter periplasmic adaptor subunit [Geminicoccus sp.]HMU50357.1 efflux RND transporter periplasmic adaptor subunit [Geminicoccaceae bacterium]